MAVLQFTIHALQQVFELTQGQPWLVNALGRELCFDDYAIPWNKTVNKEDVNNAAEILIKRRDVHLDQLADKLTEPRVERIIQSILIGEEVDNININEDKQYLIDLDIEKVLEAYIEFYKEHSELVTQRKTYNEAAHHLLFMAWLQRIVNGGGYITREYAAGLKRLDLCIDFAGERFAFELKLSSKKALNDGKTQLVDYLKRLSLNSGWLIIFSRKPVEDIETVGRREIVEEDGKRIEIIWL